MKQDRPEKKTGKQKRCSAPNCRKLFPVTEQCACPYCGKLYPRLSENAPAPQRQKKAPGAKIVSLAKPKQYAPESAGLALWLLDGGEFRSLRFDVAIEIHRRLPIRRHDADLMTQLAPLLLCCFPDTKRGRNQANSLVNSLTARGAKVWVGPREAVPPIPVCALGFSRRIAVMLSRSGISTLQELCAKSEAELLKLRCVDKWRLEEFKQTVARFGFSLRETN